MGCEGHEQAITPNMDRLAAEGMRFAKAYAQNPICTPSRMSIYTGQYCHNHGYYGLGGPRPEGIQSYLGHFRQHGYRTGAVGKLHVPNEPRDWLLDHVDLWASCTSAPTISSGPSPYHRYLQALGLADSNDNLQITGYISPHPSGFPQNQLRARPSHLPLEHNVESWCVRQAIEFMERYGAGPFCLQVSLPRPHAAYTPDQQFWDLYPDDIELSPTFDQDPSGRPPHFRRTHQRFRAVWDDQREPEYEAAARNIWRGYLGCVSQVDYGLGLLLDYLDASGLAGNTLVVYNADHGAYSTCMGIQEKAPGICSELVCRVPMIWRVPEVTAAGAVCGELVENIDMTPTLMALCGLPVMAGMDGVDLSGLLHGGTEAVKELAVTEHPHSKALRWGPWRYVHYQPGDFADADVPHGSDFGELYHLEDDPHETRNLYGDPAFCEVVVEGERKLAEWLVATRHVRNTFSGGPNSDNYL